MNFLRGDVVTIIVDNPDGISFPHTAGRVGCVKQITKEKDGVANIAVIDEDGDTFVYGEDQLRYATNEEVVNAFVKVMRWREKYENTI